MGHVGEAAIGEPPRGELAEGGGEAARGAARQLVELAGRMERIALRFAVLRSEEFDITLPQFRALRSLRHKACRMTELTDRLMVSKQWVSQSVDSLVRAGLATRREDPDDRRHSVVTATPEGLDRLEAFERELADFLAGALGGLTASDIEQLDQAFADLNTHLARRRDQGYFRLLRRKTWTVHE